MSSTLQAIEISPVTPAFGARVDGLNAREPLDEDVVRELKDAIAKYKVLFLTGQHLDEQQHARLAAYFGAPHETSNRFDVEYEESGLTDVKVVSHFHSDLVYKDEQPAYAPFVGTYGDPQRPQTAGIYPHLSFKRHVVIGLGLRF